ncbi:hypothetical protein FJR11_19805 [Anabaena sp. UHCC 0187]|uniref:hypothetical protein n=1 Tax=Anabaena sp. UHCC 0187 TaxID=2590018 RepID=UPI0014456E17|nr:hypothetical protein [Anabaena sp. UHCC 0187]MTJ14779.1 hypothetical protein [Anabaena sp. UHCC 0187]
MQYALLTKIGGELIEASRADYQDYYGFLKCPECNEPVFLRQGHLRQRKQIKASFVHHKAVPEISACELRIGKYSKEDIEAFASKAKKQRLQKLNISMWKYVKTNMAVNFKDYDKLKTQTKNVKSYQGLLVYADNCLTNNVEFIVDNLIPQIGKVINNKNAAVGEIMGLLDKFNSFVNDLKSDWLLHEKIAKEAAGLFLSPQMKEIRYRALVVLCYPKNMELLNRDLVELNMQSETWNKLFTNYITLQIALVFISINWIKLLP